MYRAISSGGYTIDVCEDCINERYVCCDDCEEYVHVDDVKTVYDEDGNERNVCPSCIYEYQECEDCGRMFRSDLLVDGRCLDCAAQVSDDESEENKEEIV